MANWINIGATIKEIGDEPWQMYWSEAKSTSQEFRDFLIDPKVVMNEVKGIGKDFRISTEIINHDVSFKSDLVCRVMFVFPDEKLVKIVMYKHRPE